MKTKKGYEIIKFGHVVPKRYKKLIRNLEASQDFIKIYDSQKPYVAICFNGKIVSCLWLETEEDEREFSIITKEEHSNKGLATWLISDLVDDFFHYRIDAEICCVPVNQTIKRIIKRFGFKEEYKGSGTWFYDL